jgi:hypothetical protein
MVIMMMMMIVIIMKEKKEIPYKKAFEGHRVHSGYKTLSLNPAIRGWVTSVSNTSI